MRLKNTMHIQHEANTLNSIQKYGANTLEINDTTYNHSIIIPYQGEINPWPVSNQGIDAEALSHFFNTDAEVIIIGVNQTIIIPPAMLMPFYEKRVGIECMNIGAAARTFNVLLQEGRKVYAGFMINQKDI